MSVSLRLPDSIWLEVFSCLSKRDLCVSSQVCRTWRRVSFDKTLWKNLTTTELGIKESQVTDETVKMLVIHTVNLNTFIFPSCNLLTNKSLFSLALVAKNLQTLDLSGCSKISDRGLMVLQKHCKTLKIINLLDTRVTDVGLTCLLSENLQLKELSANASAMTLKSMEVLAGHCKSLRYLHVTTGCTEKKYCKTRDNLTNDMVMLLALNCPELKLLKLKYEVAYVSDYVLACLAHHCPYLTDVTIGELEEERLLTDVGIANFCLRLPKLRHLTLKETGVSDFSIMLISQTCKELRSLDLKHCFRLHDLAVLNLVHGCTKLESLHLGSGWDGRLTNLSALSIAQSPCAKNLKSLSMYLWEVDDFGLFVLSCNLSKLVHLSLEGCLHITYDGLKKVLPIWKNLESLDLSFTELITSDDDLISLFSLLGNLKRLRLFGLQDITALGINELKYYLPDCIIESEKVCL